MNAKNKAKQLINKFSAVGLQQRNEGIACALIAVNQMLKLDCDKKYWTNVKNQIKKKV